MPDSGRRFEVDEDSRRCTDEGITVVALDGRAGDLQRARPEGGYGYARRTIPVDRWRMSMMLLAAGIVTLAIARLM